MAFGTIHDKRIIVNKISTYSIKNINEFEFENWLFNTIYNQSLYKIEEKSIYCIYFIYSKNFIDKYNEINKTDILNLLYPDVKESVIDKLKITKFLKIYKKYKFLKYLK